MADYMQRYADKEVEKLGRKIARIYRQAAREIKEKLESFNKAHDIISDRMLQDVKDGKITERDYKDWLRNQVFIGDRWKAKLDEITKAYREADEKARKLVGEKNKDIFLHAANWQAKDTSRAVNGAVSFDMYDRKTVDRLIRDNPKMLPEWKINQKKDYIWNEKRVQNAVAQGIVQGESVYKIGKRLTDDLSASNAGKMDMFARTAVTGAQNAGRMERLHEAEEMGIKVKKKWLSAHDARVRDTHAYLDGQEVDVDEPFVTQEGDHIMYPGDPSADPALVYNCRCTMIYVYPKYQPNKKGEEEGSDSIRNTNDISEQEVGSTESEANRIDWSSAYNFADGDAELTNMLMSDDISDRMSAVDTILGNEEYGVQKSAYNGKVKIVPDGSLGINHIGMANYDGSIEVAEGHKNDLKVYIHEDLHMRSIHLYGEEKAKSLYQKTWKIEEGSVEYFTKQICDKKGISYKPSYGRYVEALKTIHDVVVWNESEYSFAKRILAIPVEQRYNEIENMVTLFKKSKKQIRKEVLDRLNNALSLLEVEL